MHYPDQKQQIVLSHAPFIRQVVMLSQSPEQVKDLDNLLQMATTNGWGKLVQVLQKICKGNREASLLKPLDSEDQAIAEAIMLGLQDPATLPDEQQANNPTLAAPGLAHMIHAAARAPKALILISNMAEQMSSAGGNMARLASVMRPLINGERNLDKLCHGMHGQGEKLITDILHELELLDNPT